MFRNYFNEVWNLHFNWGNGVLYKPQRDLKTAKLITSKIPGNGYKFLGRDTWMGYDKNAYTNNQVKVKIVDVLPKTFSDYDTVLGKVFSDFPGNQKYNEICQKTINGELVGKFPGLKSELYLIYENNKPV